MDGERGETTRSTASPTSGWDVSHMWGWEVEGRVVERRESPLRGERKKNGEIDGVGV